MARDLNSPEAAMLKTNGNNKIIKSLAGSLEHIENAAQLSRLFPIAYHDFSQSISYIPPDEPLHNREIALEGHFDAESFRLIVKSRTTKEKKEYAFLFGDAFDDYIRIGEIDNKYKTPYNARAFAGKTFIDPDKFPDPICYFTASFLVGKNEEIVHVNWLCSSEAKDAWETRYMEKIWLLGNVTQLKAGFYCNPQRICIYPNDLKIFTEYPAIRGISDDVLREWIDKAINGCGEDFLPESILWKYHLIDEKTAVFQRHHPDDISMLRKAKNRLLFDDILYFICRLQYQGLDAKSGKKIGKDGTLPISMSTSERRVYESILSVMKQGNLLNGLLEEEHSTFKIIFQLLSAVCNCGYKGVLIIQSAERAEWIYREAAPLFEDSGVKSCLFTNELSEKKKGKTIAQIEDPQTRLIIATPHIFEYPIPNPGLIVMNTENSIGYLANRGALALASDNGAHILRVSNVITPDKIFLSFMPDNIQRQTLHLEKKDYFVKCLLASSNEIDEIIQKSVKENKKAIIICPPSGYTYSSSFLSIMDDTYEKYNLLNFKVILLSEQQGKKLREESVHEFLQSGNLLITTLNACPELCVSHASIIIVRGAEHFRLATLCRLRDSVSNKGLFVMESYDDSTRISCVAKRCSSFDAERDDWLYTKSHKLIGKTARVNRYLMQALDNPPLYQAVFRIYNRMKQAGLIEDFINGYEIENGVLYDI